VIDVTAHLLALPLALVVDRLVGDPAWLWARVPHPVALMGRLIGGLDASLNDPARSFATRRARGLVAVIALTATAAFAGTLIALLISNVPLPVAVAGETAVAAIFLAQRSLVDHVAQVARRLDREGIDGGREAVAQIVGRDVSVLDEPGVSRAAIESLAENFSDGVVAPTLWYALLGLPGLFVYKIVNTADSMIGHRSPRHAAFGWAAARLDDLLNLVPARLTALLIAAAVALRGRSGLQALAAAWRDARLHKSPNAGWPEAAVGGALGLALGGPRRYGTLEVDGAWLNVQGRTEAGTADIRAAIRLVDAAWVILLALAVLIALATAL
jgi:adenosylcobinamide-phosphate synthase